jgi:histidyl-tRNA synthetase
MIHRNSYIESPRLLDGELTVVDEIEALLPQIDAPLRLLFEVEGAGSAYIANLRAALCPSIPELSLPLDELSFSVKALERAGITPVVQAVLARSFEYYSGIVFKVYADAERICSGGRYDGLIEAIGDRAVPACGFAHYLSPIIARAGPVGGQSKAVRVAVDSRDLEPGLIAETITVAKALREAGFYAETTRGVDSQPTHWLVLNPEGRHFRLIAGDDDRTFDRLDEVIAVLESGQ